MISTGFIDYIILNSKIQLELTKGQNVAKKQVKKGKNQKMHLGMPFLYRSKNVNLENVPSHDSHKNLLIYFCYLDNEALPFWG